MAHSYFCLSLIGIDGSVLTESISLIHFTMFCFYWGFWEEFFHIYHKQDNEHLHISKYSMLKNNNTDFHTFPINNYLPKGLDEQYLERTIWFVQSFYTITDKDGKIRGYNMGCDMQGVREFGGYKVSIMFNHETTPYENGSYKLTSGMHRVGVLVAAGIN